MHPRTLAPVAPFKFPKATTAVVKDLCMVDLKDIYFYIQTLNIASKMSRFETSLLIDSWIVSNNFMYLYVSSTYSHAYISFLPLIASVVIHGTGKEKINCWLTQD